MNKKWLSLLSIILLISLLSGCVGKREINDLALVMAVGIDEEQKEDYKVTVQVARPADARGQTGAPAGNTGDPIWSANAEGDTIFNAIRNLAKFSSRRIFWAHNFIIVINEDLAKKGIGEIIDFFTRNPELRMNTWIVVTPDSAEEVVSTVSGLEVMPGEALDKLFRYTLVSAQAPRTEIRDVYSAYLSEGTEPILARVKLVDRGVSNKKPGQAGSVKQIELAGAGIFRGEKMVGTLTGNETSMILPFIGEVETGNVVMQCPNDEKGKISLEIRHPKLSVEPSYKNGKPEFTVSATINSIIVEAGCRISLEDEAVLDKLESQQQKLFIEEVTAVINKLQNEYQADVLQFGKIFNNKYPAEWKKLKENWEEEFKNAKVKVNVDSRIRATPLYYQPLKEKDRE